MIAQEPSQVSFLSTVKSMKGCWSGGDDDQYRFIGGTQAPLLRLQNREASTIDIELNSPVRTISASTDGDGNSQYVVSTAEGLSVRAQHVIVTGSPAAVSTIQFEPPMDAPSTQLLQRMPMGTSMKYMLVYDEGPWWRDGQNTVPLTGAIMSTKMPNVKQNEDAVGPLTVSVTNVH